jgi:hypothetical protein
LRTFRLAAVLLAAAAAARAQSEGVAEFKGSMAWSGGHTIPSAGKAYFARDAYRMEWEVDLSAVAAKGKAPAGAVPARYKTITIQKLSDPDHALQINEVRRTYAIADLKKLRESLAGRERPTYSVKKLGRDKVAGYSCVRALVTSSSGTESELCVAVDLIVPSSWLFAFTRKEASDNMLTALRDNGLQGFPIRLTVRGGAGKEAVSTMELVRFERKSLPASLFEVPAGYTQTDEVSLNLTEEQERMMKQLREKMKSRGRS